MKKATGRMLSLVLALVIVLSMGTAVCAQDVTVGSGSGNITISNTTEGKDYALYKIFDATTDGTNIVYKLPAGKTDLKATVSGTTVDGAQWFELDASNYIKAKTGFSQTTVETANFKNWALAYATQIGTTTTANADGTLTFKQVPFGYYLITSSLGALITVNSTKPDVTVIDKNQKPDWDETPGKDGKVVLEGGNKYVVNEANLNEDISFSIGITATNYFNTDKIFRYVVKDTIDAGMSYKTRPSVTVGAPSSPSPLTEGTDYTITFYKADGVTSTTTLSEAQSFRIEIPWTNNDKVDGTHLYPSLSEIHVTYLGILDPEKAANVKYSAANENTAGFDYFKGTDDPAGADPNHHSATKKTETFITDLDIFKYVDVSGTKTALPGAEFTLTGTGNPIIYTNGTRFVKDNATGTYWLLNDGTYTTTDPNGAGVNQSLYATPLTDKYKTEAFTEVQGAGQTNTTIKGYVDSTGHLVFKGLGEGTYTLTESVVPEGYNKAGDVTFTVVFDKTTKTFSISQSPSPVTTRNSGKQLQVEIENSTGTVLPSTGGVGTTLFYILGALMVLGASVLIVTRRRVRTEE